MQTEISYTILVLVSLALISARFNFYIDGVPADDRSDGETARWVICGVSYTGVGVALLQWIWLPYLPTDWRIVPATLIIFFVAFTASGLPMYGGDVRRSHSTRRRIAGADALEEAERIVTDKS